MEYLLHLLILIGIYVMLSQSLCLSAGFGGMISLAHAGFYGVGAYTAALLSINYQVPFLLVLPIAMLLSGLLALLVSAIALRTIDDYFIICTLGIQIIVFSFMNNWMSLTRGPLGIPGIPNIQLFGIVIESKMAFLLLTIFFVAYDYWRNAKFLGVCHCVGISCPVASAIVAIGTPSRLKFWATSMFLFSRPSSYAPPRSNCCSSKNRCRAFTFSCIAGSDENRLNSSYAAWTGGQSCNIALILCSSNLSPKIQNCIHLCKSNPNCSKPDNSFRSKSPYRKTEQTAFLVPI